MRTCLSSTAGPLNSSLLETPPPTTAEGSCGQAPPLMPGPGVGLGWRGVEGVLLDRELLFLVVSQGVVSGSGGVVSHTLQLLVDLFSLREELIWSELKQRLVSMLPYVEVRAQIIWVLAEYRMEWNRCGLSFSIQCGPLHPHTRTCYIARGSGDQSCAPFLPTTQRFNLWGEGGTSAWGGVRRYPHFPRNSP